MQFGKDVYKCLVTLQHEPFQGIVGADVEFRRMIQNHSWATKQIVNYVFRCLDGEILEFPLTLNEMVQ